MGEAYWRRSSDWGEQHQKQQGGGGCWGRGGGGGLGSSSKKGKPPVPVSWQPTVPSWEKRFCTSVGRIPWGKLCETKRLMAYYKNVVEWDDSAGEEAFCNAKARFWAEINHLPCDIDIPGPDLYIDEIDWDAEIDPQLLLDLDKEPPPPDIEQMDGYTASFSSSWDKPIPCSGWGDAEDSLRPVKDTPTETGWAGWQRNDNNDKGWGCSDGWGDAAVEDNSGWGAGAWEENSWDNRRGNGLWEQWETRNDEMNYSESRRYGRKREGGGRYGSRYPASSYQRDDLFQAPNRSIGRNCRGRKRPSHYNEQPAPGKQPLAQHWNPCILVDR